MAGTEKGRGAPAPGPGREGPASIAIALLAFLAACQDGPPEHATRPPLPSVNLDGMEPDAAAAIRAAGEHAAQRPVQADASGTFGTILQAYGLREESVACYRRAEALEPGDWRWPYYLGSVHAELGRYREAAVCFRRAAALEPRSVAARIHLGNTLLRDGRPRESRRVFEGLIESNPGSAASHLGLARAHDADGKSEAALRSYMQALDLAPEAGAIRYALATLYNRLGRDLDASRQLKLIGEREPTEPSFDDPLATAVLEIRTDKHTLLERGLQLASQGSPAQAAQAFEAALGLDSAYVQARINLVATYGRLGLFDEAQVHYERALELAPDSEELHVNWGTLQADRDWLSSAARSFRRALEINPHSADTHADLGLVLNRAGEATQAVRHFLLALEKDPGHRSANFHLARLLIAEDRTEEAIRHLLRTVEPVDDPTPTYLYALADAYLRAGKPDLALGHLARALDLAIESGKSELSRDLQRDLEALRAAQGR
ncbi:MAG: tetratricopeptide repeat protein [Bryobacterales bacterium]|nr:tetratricopeptide repeat protein [Bryobacterales bacterium]